MRPIRNFDEYIEEGIIKKQSPDKSRAKDLRNESGKTGKFLFEIISQIGINDRNANTIIKIAYDVIMEMIQAKMIENGFNASGKGAHEAEVSYLRVLSFNEKDIQFCDQLRYFRNGIMYYGKSFDRSYAEKVISYLDSIEKKLKE
jgi:hypothetical protein